MEIFRVAHPDVMTKALSIPAGPYTAHNNLDYAEDWPLYNQFSEVSAVLHRIPEQRTPTPWEDGLNGIDNDEVCCFTDIVKAQEWFCAFNDDLREAGFMLFVYVIDEQYVREGYRQALAKIENAKLVEVVDIPFEDTFEIPVFCYECFTSPCEGTCD